MPSKAFRDIAASLERHELWRTLGWADIRLRYRRTLLGPLWLTLSTGITVFAIGLLYAVLLNQEISSYLPSLAIGIITWTFFSSSVNEGCMVFVGSVGFIKAYVMPLSIYVFRLLWRNIIILLHNFVIVIVMWMIFRWQLTLVALLSLAGYALILIFVLGIVLFFGVLCTRYRDIPQIVSSILQLLFIITPIMWAPENLGEKRWFADFNPLFSIIEVVRAPLLGQVPDWRQWSIALGCAVLSLACGWVFYERYSYRVAYWL